MVEKEKMSLDEIYFQLNVRLPLDSRKELIKDGIDLVTSIENLNVSVRDSSILINVESETLRLDNWFRCFVIDCMRTCNDDLYKDQDLLTLLKDSYIINTSLFSSIFKTIRKSVEDNNWLLYVHSLL